ncbi:unnamed protein product [Rotaria socialis]|uniref:EGF-like domain-containing protein n=1 Tax=Rotaria socialis TaxID=392032 RepID=A0A820XET8_9BILA|nr:unnamed protein product [Rotaria socialis]CAF4531580.1 unnamed protein product [Rotaria socialis]
MVSSASNNTTLFDNFTTEWVDFNFLTCVLPKTVNISLLTCLPSVLYTEINDVDCLAATEVNFDQNTCQSTTHTTAYTGSSPMTTKQTTIQTITNTKAQTSVSTTATVSGLSVTTMSVTTEKQATTGTMYTSIIATSTGASSSATVIIDKTDTSTTSISTFRSSTTTTVTRTTATATTTTTTTVTTTTGTTTGTTTTTTTTTKTTTTATTTTTTTTTATRTTINDNHNNITTMATYTTRTTIITRYNNLFSCENDSYIGTYCNISSDACTITQPCQNGGTCFPNNTVLAGYYCECLTGYEGYDCENDQQACTDNKCWHNGTCMPVNAAVASTDGLNFKCDCIEGYNGAYCELNVDLCANITCENRGICQTVAMQWQCLCLNSVYYYGDLCQFKTNKLKIREILSSSFAYIAIGAISVTCTFVIVMDVLKYAFHIDPVECERDNYRRRREAQRRAKRPIKPNEAKVALRFQYVS